MTSQQVAYGITADPIIQKADRQLTQIIGAMETARDSEKRNGYPDEFLEELIARYNELWMPGVREVLGDEYVDAELKKYGVA